MGSSVRKGRGGIRRAELGCDRTFDGLIEVDFYPRDQGAHLAERRFVADPSGRTPGAAALVGAAR